MNKQLALIAGFACVWVLLGADIASAQINRSGGHRKYSAEIEPHLVLQWSNTPGWNNDGIGVGLRGSIPVIESGPVTTINNSLAVGFGLDWAHFGDQCDYGYFKNNYNGACGGDTFWLPVVLQWNFYFSDLISAFPELGLALEHSSFDFDGNFCGGGNNRYACGWSGGTHLELVFWLGIRFHLADSVALTLRLGTPSVLIGASFFL